SAFTSIANQYRRFMKTEHPDIRDDAEIFVREVRSGSIIADLVPVAGSLIGTMDQVLIVRHFVDVYGGMLRKYFERNGRQEDASKSDLKDFMGQVASIARSKNGKGQIRAVSYRDGKRKIEAAIEFNAETARMAGREIEHHKSELDKIVHADHLRVLMTFKRSDVGDAAMGVRSGERVIIEEISDKDFALIYVSELAESQIKDLMRNTEENIFHKGFVVDVNVTTKGGRPVAYAVTNLHQIIDIGD
ncbi:MAG: hypothetical protein P1V34_14395, partial [Alphaproteobacteria bacterium]|nr:hypothetical protein [Alphaproteobacteria bacterium]